jgi:hypothetical protein
MQIQTSVFFVRSFVQCLLMMNELLHMLIYLPVLLCGVRMAIYRILFKKIIIGLW